MVEYSIEVEEPGDLAITFPNDPRYGWRMVRGDGRPVARSWITYTDPAHARSEATRVLNRLGVRAAG